MRAEILCVGTELLIGQTVNTNATWLARELAVLGIDLLFVTTVGDNFERLDGSLRTAWGRSDLVLLTGGLGPTADDITVEAIARFLGEPLVEREDEVARLAALFARRGRELTPTNRKQALFPPSARPLANPAGSASGAHVERDGRTLMAFPGVPKELYAMWAESARPLLEGRSGATTRSRLLKFVGVPEAAAADRVRDLLDGTNPTVAPYASEAEVHLRVTAKAADEAAAEALLAPVVAEVRARLAEAYFGEDDQTLPGVVGAALTARSEWVATAESCTGGLVASRLTDVAGASGWFASGVVAYSEGEKERLLGVPRDLLAAHTAVSAPVAEAMAQGVRARLGSQWGLSVTGYAGGGLSHAQDGLVYVGVSGPSGTWAREFRFGGLPRERVKWFAANAALTELWRAIGRSPERDN